jgi:hypothetical protein
MYSREEASQLKHNFWTSFGKYLAPVLSAEGEKVNWVNYKTREPNLFFKMDADNESAAIAIVLNHKNTGIQELYFEQLMELRKMLEETLGEEWQWEKLKMDEHGKAVSRVYKTLNDVSIFKQEDWPEMISFFKPRIIALDEFWSQARYAFEALR